MQLSFQQKASPNQKRIGSGNFSAYAVDDQSPRVGLCVFSVWSERWNGRRMGQLASILMIGTASLCIIVHTLLIDRKDSSLLSHWLCRRFNYFPHPNRRVRNFVFYGQLLSYQTRSS
jgi:hypothetical protein